MLLTAQPMTDFEQRVSEVIYTDDLDLIKDFIDELEDYGITTEEQIDDAFSGCYPSVENFCEDLIDGIGYLDNAPSLIQDCIDYERMWHHYLSSDYFYIESQTDKYFFNNNF